MLLFSRVVTLVGSPRRVLPWVHSVTDYVRGHSELDVSVWSCTFGYPLGTFAWSTVVESQAAFADATAKLLVDDGYFDVLEQGQDLIAHPPQDLLRELVFGQPGDPPPIGSIATITSATAMVDRMTDAVVWGVEIGQYVAEVAGVPVSVLTNVFGQMGQVTWIGIQPDLASVDALRTKLNADTNYTGRLAATKDLYLPGSGHVGQLMRLG